MFVGVDVGGTNTDAVLMDGRQLTGATKVPTTADVTTGIAGAVSELLAQTGHRDLVRAVVVGTTHFTNALLERANLAPTAVMRLSLPATELLASPGRMARRSEKCHRRPCLHGWRRQRI